VATTMTLAQLRTAIRQRADMVNSTFISDAELNSYINQSYFELYDLLVQKYGDNYYVASPLQFDCDGSSQQYALPNGTNYDGADPFYKLLGVDLQLGNQQDSFVTLKPFNFSDRNRYAVPNFQSFYGVTNLRYRLNGDNIWFTPIPASNQTIQVWYVPRLTQLTDDADTCDGISGWTEYIICDAAIKCLTKEESDPSVFMAQKQALIQRIEAAAENRDAANPATVADTQAQGADWAVGNGGGYGSGSY
jgi:hypothetical protein